MAKCKSAFANEDALVDAFVVQLEKGVSPWLTQSLLREFDYVSGRTDVLSLGSNDEIIAFEAKLKNWRKALHQAWRNTSFANRAYVVLPREHATMALLHRDEFETWGIGLCLVDGDGLEIVIDSITTEPVLPWLNNKAKQTLRSHGCGCRR